MKILITSRGVVPVKAGCGGAEIVVYQLARSMALQGNDVTLVGEVDENDFELPERLRVEQVESQSHRRMRFLPGGLPTWIVQHLLGNVLVALRARALLREQRFDVVHAHGALSALVISFGNRSTPLVYTEHDATPWSCRYRVWYERWMRKTIYRALNVTVFKRADRVITVFPSQAREIVTYWGIDPARVSTITNGTDADAFRPSDEDGVSVKAALGFDRYALYVGGLVPRKCPDIVLEAAAELDDVPIVFVGDGPMRSRLARRAKELGVADRVALLGGLPPSELGEIYREADVLVLPTVSDTFPLVALEAMACGTPVIASRVSGLPEMVEDWQTGFLVKPGDIGQLAMGIRFLTGDAALRDRMGANGRRRVVAGFRWPLVAERYLCLYRSAAGVAEPEPEPPAAVVTELSPLSPLAVDQPEWVASA
ncbi:MAG: glycosyltransferase family 4 protein [Actinomycetota bacterium]